MRSVARAINTLLASLARAAVCHASPCVLCGYTSSEHNICADCAAACVANNQMPSIAHIAHLYARYLYQFPVHLLLHKYKYGKQQQLTTALTHLLLKDLRLEDTDQIDCVVPVPLHLRKLRTRGFNQSLFFASAVARAYQLPLNTDCIVRARNTASQVECGNKKARLENVSGAFVVRGDCPKHILLVDDVVTTGATLSEIARTLKRHGTQRVDALVLCAG